MTAERSLALAFLEAHPRQAARALEQLTAPQCAAVLAEAPESVAAAAVREMDAYSAADCLTALRPRDAAAIVAELAPDDAGNLLRRVAAGEGARQQVMAALPREQLALVERVLRYPDGTAGALMDPSIFVLPDDITVADARSRFRRASRDLLYYLYVVDREDRLVGVLDIPELMVARPRDELRHIMHADVDSVSAWAAAPVIRAHLGWRRYHAMPVVDENGRLLGAIRYQTLRHLEHAADSGGGSPVAMTALALGELYRIGISGLVEGLAAARSNQAPTEGRTAEVAAERDAELDKRGPDA